MNYMGSKRRIAAKILPVILKDRVLGQAYVEPFVGGGSMIERVTGRRIGSDINEYAIAALRLIRDTPEKLPRNNKEFTKADYLSLREVVKQGLPHPKGLAGVAGFAYSFGARFGGSWAQNKKGQDYVSGCYNSAQRQSALLKHVRLICGSYDRIPIPTNSIIYCDPPYMGTGSYNGTAPIDYDLFWSWARTMKGAGHSVFVSEYTSPDFAREVWSQEIFNNMSPNAKKTTEKLFILR